MLPYQPHSPTSHNAAQVAARTANTARYKVYAYICANPGVSDDDVIRGLEMNPNTARPRRVELENYGLIRKNGIKGTQSSGEPAATYEAVEGVPYPAKFPLERVKRSKASAEFLTQANEMAEALRNQEVPSHTIREDLWQAFLSYAGLESEVVLEEPWEP
jgi:hypothetical protein